MTQALPVPGLTRDLMANHAKAPDRVHGGWGLRPSTGGQA